MMQRENERNGEAGAMKAKKSIQCKISGPMLLGVLCVLTAGEKSQGATLVCDIYATGGTPCVAAYSTVRALYGAYSGSLYQVRRADNTTKDVGVLAAGGEANAATQDAFCAGSTCTISIIYDQSGKGNHLTKAPGGSKDYGPAPDLEAVASDLPIYLNGHKVYGVHITPNSSWTGTTQVGYRNTKANGIAKGDNPETIYMVTDGTYFNGQCCFDFGNAEMQPVAGGYGTMEALYFGNNNWWDKGVGTGPWIMADLEVGVYNMGGSSNYSDANKNGNKTNNNDVSFAYPFVTAMLKGNSKNATNGGPFTLKGGNAQSGTLATVWDGAFPVGYFPMNRQGGIVLGVGGDNSGQSRGNFFEGVMTTGYASTATDNAVQASIIAAGYGKTTTTAIGAVAAKRSGIREIRWQKDALSVEGLESGKLLMVTPQGQRRILNVTGGQAYTGRLPAGTYFVRSLGEASEATQRFVVLP